MSELASRPLKRQAGLLVKTVQDEIIVYDLDSTQANCLNQTAALVWEYADGMTGVPELAEKVSAELGAPVDEKVVWYALDQLNRKRLLQGELNVPAQMSTLSRRDFMKKVALVGAVAAIPVIVSMAAPSPSEAATCLATGSACTSGPQCCSGICTGGTLCL